MTEFLEMGGYARYVWPAYGVALAILGALTVFIIRRNAQVREQLVRIEVRADDKRRGDVRQDETR